MLISHKSTFSILWAFTSPPLNYLIIKYPDIYPLWRPTQDHLEGCHEAFRQETPGYPPALVVERYEPCLWCCIDQLCGLGPVFLPYWPLSPTSPQWKTLVRLCPMLSLGLKFCESITHPWWCWGSDLDWKWNCSWALPNSMVWLETASLGWSEDQHFPVFGSALPIPSTDQPLALVFNYIKYGAGVLRPTWRLLKGHTG